MLTSYRVDLASTSADEDAVRALLREFGLKYRLYASTRLLYKEGFLTDVGPGEFLLLAVPLVTFLGAFMKGFGGRLGEQSADAAGKLFSDWLKRTHKELDKGTPASGGHAVGVFVHDKEKALKITLPAELPPGAYGELMVIGEARKKSKRKQEVTNIWYENGHWHVMPLLKPAFGVSLDDRPEIDSPKIRPPASAMLGLSAAGRSGSVSEDISGVAIYPHYCGRAGAGSCRSCGWQD